MPALNKYLRITLALLLFILAASAAAWFSADSPPGEEKEGDATPGAEFREDPVPEPAPSTDTIRQFTLELLGSLQPGERSRLESMAEPAGSAGKNTLLVRARESRRDELASLPFVKAVREYRPGQKLSPDLEKNNDKKKVRVTVTLFSAGDMEEVTALVKQSGGAVLKAKGLYIRAEVGKPVLEKLAASPRVMYVEKNTRPEFLNDRARDITGARPLAIPGFVTAKGLTGKGQTIGLADSGLDKGSLGNLHPDLQSPPGRKPRVIMLKSWAGVEVPADTVGHGTHMAGTLVGSGKASGGKYAGVAPGASLYFQGIVDEDDNPALPLDLRELFKPAYEAGVRVHVNGWGRKKNTYGSASAQIDRFIRRYPDFLAVFGAGNSGPRVGSLTIEANSKNALVVGASVSPRPAFDNNLGTTDSVAGFSSRGPAGDGRIKPDLVSPGTDIISTASGLTGGNLAGRPEYTVMEGTSMASAVAGGAAALVRQYLEESTPFGEPSAALVKAALINGARRLDDVPSATGFGLLDTGGTVTALESDLFRLAESEKGISTGETLTYEREITGGEGAFKATLAWTDPEAMPGTSSALVNDLDLVVTSPNGEKYYGNDFNDRGVRDTRNNVEQVYILRPEPGTYTVTVQGKSVQEDVSPAKGVNQDFALAYGQVPVRAAVVESDSDSVTLAGGRQITLPRETILAVNDLMRRDSTPPPGTELYLVPGADEPRLAYGAVRTGRVNGVKALSVGDITVLVRINREYREGGYAVDKRAQKALTVNGLPVKGDEYVIPPGAGVTGNVNPFRQTLWKADATGNETEGVIAAVNREERTIKLLNNEQAYQLAGEASISFSDEITGGVADLPFGAPVSASLEKILPGMPVTIVRGDNGRVYYLAVKRHLAVGRVSELNPATGRLTLASGDSYHLLPGIKVVRDGNPVAPEEMEPGNLAVLNLVPDSTEVLEVTLYSQVHYGKVIYTEEDTLYLMDNQEGFSMLKLDPGAGVFRWGMPAGVSVLSPGQWVRVAGSGPEGILRVDVAEEAGQIEALWDSYIPAGGLVKTGAGGTYRLSPAAVVSKNDYCIEPADIIPGEPVTLTALYGPEGNKIIISLEASTREGVKTPELKVDSTVPFQDYSLVSGHTTADSLHVRFPGGRSEKVEVTDSGEFYYPVKVEKAVQVQLVALDRETGGVAGLRLSFSRPAGNFPDIAGHWAEIDIRQMARRGMLKGYPDGTFRPDRPVTRVEFTAMLSRLMGRVGSVPEIPYKDKEEIPEWARSAVALAAGRGLVAGYADNTFRPLELITRQEAAAMLVRAYDILEGLPAETPAAGVPYVDREKIAPWAREDVALARKLGLLTGRPENRFIPRQNTTRAETAAALNRFLIALTGE